MRYNGYHGGDIDLGYSCCQKHHFQYLQMKIIWKSALQVHFQTSQIMNYELI